MQITRLLWSPLSAHSPEILLNTNHTFSYLNRARIHERGPRTNESTKFPLKNISYLIMTNKRRRN